MLTKGKANESYVDNAINSRIALRISHASQ